MYSRPQHTVAYCSGAAALAHIVHQHHVTNDTNAHELAQQSQDIVCARIVFHLPLAPGSSCLVGTLMAGRRGCGSCIPLFPPPTGIPRHLPPLEHVLPAGAGRLLTAASACSCQHQRSTLQPARLPTADDLPT